MKWMNNKRLKEASFYLLIGTLFGLIIGGFLWILVRQPQGTPMLLATRPGESNITIYISGEVVTPGVYQLPFGSRITDAVTAAGGTLPDSDINIVNLAEILSDSDHVYIPKVSEFGDIGYMKININFATQAELETLPGIGRSVASQIIDYRITNGSFSSIEEIQKVTGIGPATYEKIRNFITVGG